MYFVLRKLPITMFAVKWWTLTGSASIQDWYHLVEEGCACVIPAEQIL